MAPLDRLDGTVTFTDVNSEGSARLQRPLALFYGLAAVTSMALALAPRIALPFGVCPGGALAEVVPWMGALFYAGLAFLVLHRPQSPLLSLAPGLFLFVHADLATEMIVSGRPCAGCLAVAAIALAAAACQLCGDRKEWPSMALALALGPVGGFFTPFERGDEFVTRELWPVRIHESLPAWISPVEMAPCEHPTAVRMVVFEKDCRG